ncbi:hypothetical protein CFRS1_v009604 [Colletotrichum fructicola]|nr:hypothetical protein CFRS1_v009604 [Colletotrichum fructicola]
MHTDENIPMLPLEWAALFCRVEALSSRTKSTFVQGLVLCGKLLDRSDQRSEQFTIEDLLSCLNEKTEYLVRPVSQIEQHCIAMLHATINRIDGEDDLHGSYEMDLSTTFADNIRLNAAFLGVHRGIWACNAQ